ncbi:hypothetical protein [Tenacibaculum caenipelagi]|uniref:Uncharacterized protein n=1 Tax=Tenacibaculum caenipelagi TaxID=1325435 RepID=A0A4R6TDU5_9FLAO|nr:hypothetical protein [Tenacibaculum caenipelagi]TDQ27658.1 hypothetical protein DFQ07_1509 [Tenacibaculum caenipelagi]
MSRSARIFKDMKKLTEKQMKLKKARAFLNKNFPLGWNLKWKDENEEVQKLAKIIKL